MSYILDALRRADAERERERGDVPGLHSQPMAPAPAAGASSIAPWVAAAVLAGTGVSGAWWWFSRTADVPAAAATSAAAPPAMIAPTPVAAPASAVVVPPTPAVAMPAPSPPPLAAVPRAAPAALPAEAAPPPAARLRERAPAPATEAPAAVAEATPAPPPKVIAATPAPSPSPASLPTPAPPPPAVIAYEQLPEDVRRQLPVVAIGGAIYSDVPAARMLIVAGQLLREGDAVAPGITLEQIRPRSAILRWRALRYEQAF